MISSGSGRTVYDGDATLQPAFLGELFAKAKNNQIHTCLETSNFVNNIDTILENINLVLLDIKHMNEEK